MSCSRRSASCRRSKWICAANFPPASQPTAHGTGTAPSPSSGNVSSSCPRMDRRQSLSSASSRCGRPRRRPTGTESGAFPINDRDRGAAAMIVDWIYNHPTWLWGSILVVGITALACLGLALFHRLVHVEVRRAHNDLAGFSIAIISVVYAVLLAFIAVATWESFAEAARIVQEEAGYIGNLYRDTDGLPEAIGVPMRATLTQYTDAVID